MLGKTVGIEHFGADDTDGIEGQASHHFLEPERLMYFDVVVEEQQSVTPRQSRAAIAHAGEVKILGEDIDGDAIRASERALEGENVRVGRPVVDDDDFQVGIIGSSLQISDDSGNEIQAVLVGDDHRHLGRCGLNEGDRPERLYCQTPSASSASK
nr:hypothetical protein [Beijerinckia sp. L45]